MKKFLSAILVVLMVASVASVAAFAADGAAIHVADVEVELGATEVVVPINVENMPEGGITSAKIFVSYDEKLTAVEGILDKEQFTNNATWSPMDATPLTWLYIHGTAAQTNDGMLCAVKFALPADAAVGDTYAVSVELSAEDIFDMDEKEVAFEAINGSITVVEPTTEAPDTEAPDTEAPDTEAPDDTKADDTKADDTKADDTKADDTKADDTTAPAATDKPADNKAPATGDMVFVVLAVMVVALGAAIVVKKVNVK